MKKYYKFEMNVKSMSILALILVTVLMGLFYKSMNYIIYQDYKQITITFLLIFIWCILHELIHALFYYLTGTKKENISFGIALEKGVFYCLTNQEITKKGIMISLIAPFILIGILTLIIGLFIKSPILILLSIFNIGGASGDLIMFAYFFTLDNFLYTEMGEPTSFAIITDKNLLKAKHFGLNIIDYGEYKNNMFKIKTEKIKITKLSWIILIIFFILLIYNFYF